MSFLYGYFYGFIVRPAKITDNFSWSDINMYLMCPLSTNYIGISITSSVSVKRRRYKYAELIRTSWFKSIFSFFLHILRNKILHTSIYDAVVSLRALYEGPQLIQFLWFGWTEYRTWLLYFFTHQYQSVCPLAFGWLSNLLYNWWPSWWFTM